MKIKGEPIELLVWEAGGHFGRMHTVPPSDDFPPYFLGAHAFLLCFSIENSDSLDMITYKWDPEVKSSGGGAVPRLLVSCKKDLREDEDTIELLESFGRVPVSVERGEEAARAIVASYIECSSKTGEDVREVFLRATESMEEGKFAQIK